MRSTETSTPCPQPSPPPASTSAPTSPPTFPASAALWADPVVTQYIGGRPFTREESWSRLLRYAGHWLLLGFGYWVIEEKQTGRFLGEIGFADYKRDLEPSIEGIPELGWALTPTAQGQG